MPTPPDQSILIAPDGSHPVFQRGDRVWITSPTYDGGEEVYQGTVHKVSYEEAMGVHAWTYWVGDQFKRGDIIGLWGAALAPVSAVDRLAELA